eukprot:Clim_evm16s154 gene=Clim_evmTU16s154
MSESTSVSFFDQNEKLRAYILDIITGAGGEQKLNLHDAVRAGDTTLISALVRLAQKDAHEGKYPLEELVESQRQSLASLGEMNGGAGEATKEPPARPPKLPPKRHATQAPRSLGFGVRDQSSNSHRSVGVAIIPPSSETLAAANEAVRPDQRERPSMNLLSLWASQPDSNGDTPLHLAVALLDRLEPKIVGAPPVKAKKVKDKDAEGELKGAGATATVNKKDIASEKIKQRITPTEVEGIVQTLVHYAGADVMARNKLGRTPIHEACRVGAVNLVKMLAQNAPEGFTDAASLTDFSGASPLRLATQEGHGRLVQWLLNEEIDSVTDHGPLHLGAAVGLLQGKDDEVTTAFAARAITVLRMRRKSLGATNPFSEDEADNTEVWCARHTEWNLETALHTACRYGMEDAAMTLAEVCPVSLLMKDRHKRFPMRVCGNVQLLMRLIDFVRTCEVNGMPEEACGPPLPPANAALAVVIGTVDAKDGMDMVGWCLWMMAGFKGLAMEHSERLKIMRRKIVEERAAARRRDLEKAMSRLSGADLSAFRFTPNGEDGDETGMDDDEEDRFTDMMQFLSKGLGVSVQSAQHQEAMAGIMSESVASKGGKMLQIGQMSESEEEWLQALKLMLEYWICPDPREQEVRDNPDDALYQHPLLLCARLIANHAAMLSPKAMKPSKPLECLMEAYALIIANIRNSSGPAGVAHVLKHLTEHDSGLTMVHYVALAGPFPGPTMMNDLLQHGVESDAMDFDGASPVHAACLANNTAIMEQLLSTLPQDRLETIVNSKLSPRSPTLWLLRRQHCFPWEEETEEELKHRVAETPTGRANAMSQKLTLGSGWTPMHCLAMNRSGDPNVAKRLQALGADPWAKDSLAQTPLVVAAFALNTPLVHVIQGMPDQYGEGDSQLESLTAKDARGVSILERLFRNFAIRSLAAMNNARAANDSLRALKETQRDKTEELERRRDVRQSALGEEMTSSQAVFAANVKSVDKSLRTASALASLLEILFSYILPRLEMSTDELLTLTRFASGATTRLSTANRSLIIVYSDLQAMRRVDKQRAALKTDVRISGELCEWMAKWLSVLAKKIAK